MLPRCLRLRRSSDVDRVFSRGLVTSGRGMLVKSMPSRESTPRVTILVGKKLAKKAVHRNRIRRRLQEAVRLHFTLIPAGVDLLVIARDPKLAASAFRELSTEMMALLTRVRVVHEKKLATSHPPSPSLSRL